MDEITLLRHLRSDVDEPTPQALDRARARLLDRTHQPPAERGDSHRSHRSHRSHPESQAASRASSRRRRTHRLLGLGAIAATIAAVLVAVPLTGQDAPAEAAVLLTRASEAVQNRAVQNEPVAGTYQRITTRSAALSYVTNDTGAVAGAYVYRTVDDTYVPSDPGQEWVSVSAALPPGRSYGPPAVSAQARRDYAASAGVDDPTVTRAVGGGFGNGEFDSTEDEPGSGPGGEIGGQDLSYATVAELEGLPQDPEALLEDLSARSDGASTSRAVRVMTQVTTLLGSGLVDAELTATMYRAMALLPEVVITERQTALDGRSGTAFGVADDDGFATIEVIVALERGQVLGVRSRQIEAQGPVPAGTIVWSTAVTTTAAASAP